MIYAELPFCDEPCGLLLVRWLNWESGEVRALPIVRELEYEPTTQDRPAARNPQSGKEQKPFYLADRVPTCLHLPEFVPIRLHFRAWRFHWKRAANAPDEILGAEAKYHRDSDT